MFLSKALFVIMLTAALALPPAGLLGQEGPAPVRVPDWSGRPILTDGVFSPGEWDDALAVQVQPGLQLLLKESGDFVFLGLKYSPFVLSIVDLFISPDGKSVHHLHVSAQLGERLLNETPGLDDDPEFIWGDTTGWYANEVRWSEKKVQALMKEGKKRDEAQEAAVYRYDGFEFQIRRSKFASDEWRIRLETPMPPDWSPVVFPAGTVPGSTRGWLTLVLK